MTIKISVIEYGRISPPEILTIGMVEFSSKKKAQNAYEEADLNLTALMFRDGLRRLYNVKSASLSRLLVKTLADKLKGHSCIPNNFMVSKI